MFALLRCCFVVCVCAGCSVSASAQLAMESREYLNAVLWLQTGTEYHALTLQAYRNAMSKLVAVKHARTTASIEQLEAGKYSTKPHAVILDIDETVLNNSAFHAGLIKTGGKFSSQTWQEWVLSQKAEEIAGAREFVARARALHFRVVYITNRNCNKTGTFDVLGKSLDCPQKPATLDNLEIALGYRPADSDLIMAYEIKDRDDSDKKARRRAVALTHRIALMIGDDMNDFIRRVEYSEDAHDKYWGSRWFVIPNPIYGSWERRFLDVDSKYLSLKAWP